MNAPRRPRCDGVVELNQHTVANRRPYCSQIATRYYAGEERWRWTYIVILYHARVDLPIVAMEQSMQETLQVMLVIMAPSIIAVAWMVWRAA